MALSLSTALRNHLLATGSLKAGLDGGVIRVYGGTVPANADATLDRATQLLYVISLTGTGAGISLDTAASAGQIVKAPAQTWQSAPAVLAGTATFWRWEAILDTDVAETTTFTQKRLQGTAGTSNADLILSSTAIALNSVQTVDYFTVSLPI